MPLTVELHEAIAAALAILAGLGGFFAKHKGWLTIGRPIERRNCPDAVRKVCDNHGALVVDLSNITNDVTELRTAQASNNNVLHDIASKVDRLVGYHLGKDGTDLGR